MLRLILIIIAALILFRLLSSLLRGIGKGSRRDMPKKKPGGKVGEGWIVDDTDDKEKKADC